MKKIVLVAAVVLATLASNAASFAWKTSASGGKAYADSTTVLSSGTAYLIDAAVLSQADLASAIEGGKSFAEVTAGKTVGSATVTDGKISTTVSSSDYAGGTSYNFYTAIVNGDKYFASDSVSVTAADVGEATVQFKLTNATKAAGAWKDATGTGGGVPEPTSGLLLLVGGAMLALRRRRA